MKENPKKTLETGENLKRTTSDLPHNVKKVSETPEIKDFQEDFSRESNKSEGLDAIEEEKHESFKAEDEKDREIPQKQDSQSQTTCLICFDKDADAVIMDCGHGGICYGCCVELFKKKQGCYLCRKPILQVLQIEINKISGEDGQIKVISCTKMKQKKKK